jgi:site-specific recombinase XerD
MVRLVGTDDHALILLRSQSQTAIVARQVIAGRPTQKTRDAYQGDLDLWLGFCARHGFDPDQALLLHATLYRDELLKSSAPKTVVRRLASLAFIYRAMQASGVVQVNPFDGALLSRPRVSKAGTTPQANHDHVEALLAVTQRATTWEGKRDTALIRLLYDTGMRRESAVLLERADVHLDRREVWAKIKAGDKEPVILPEETCSALRDWIACAHLHSPWVFPSPRDASRPMAVTLANKIFTLRSQEAGVPAVTPHSLRVAFITEAIDSGAALHEVQSAVHHKNSATTQGYDRRRRGGTVADQVAARRGKKKR